MCGIVGCLAAGRVFSRVQADVSAMADAIAHRGPDHRGTFEKEPVSLAMNRLAIIDVVGGNQPLQSVDGQVQLIFNGEIYNHHKLRSDLSARHTFTTHSDTEVILNGYMEWGEGVFARLNGMFAIAIWDTRECRLVVARDGFGIKPLYYWSGPDCLAFASELKAFTATGLVDRACLDGVQQFLAASYVFHPFSALEGVRQLRPGHFLVVEKDGSHEERCFYDLGQTRHGTPLQTRDAAIDMIWRAFQEAVVRQTESERPHGLLLSAGIDSMAILAALHEAGMAEQLATYTVFFDHEDFSEDDLVRRLAKEWGTDSRFLKVTDQMVADRLDELFWTFDNLELLPTCVSLFAASHFAGGRSRVLLAGNGGDELFSGYPTYRATSLASGPAGRVASLLTPLAGQIPISDRYLTSGEKLRRFLIGSRHGARSAHLLWRHVFTIDDVNRVMPGHQTTIDQLYGPQLAVLDRFAAQGIEPPELYGLVDMHTWLMDCNLAIWDKAGMSASVEIRVPFLDYEFFETANEVPGHLRFLPHGHKRLFRQAVEGRLPEYITTMQKRGFQSPVVRWMRGAVGQKLRDVVKQLPGEIFSHKEISRMWDELDRGHGGNALKLWTLGCLAGWAERHAIAW